MKLTQILAAGLLLAGVGVSTEASAQRGNGYEQQYRGDRDGRYDRDDRRNDRRWGRHDNGRHNGWRNNRHHRDCRIVYRHHQRQRVCR